ncbi:MAG: hypothetical protein CVV46_05825 [Spirochaetae bacterium HGW-Spirochaetae-2]|jgi:transketolase|nr:MAG: hypothetical protein CVV46_05825 [Spirochaetae bacterium HGW-Spirochaetae-2]
MSDFDFVKEKARQYRGDTLHMVLKAGSGHVDGSCSIAELIALENDKLALGKGADDPNRDKFILSKGYVSTMSYTFLMDIGFAPKDKVRRYSIPFQGYLDLKKLPSLDCSKNSLGQGLVIATEIALGLKKQCRSEKVCFITGDGAL